MSILYSITGVITLLFLVIIATGAIRAHRHPERYGPRAAATGRPRQSRARGLARAMLETIPIVKFGDPPSHNKPTGAADVELAETDRSTGGANPPANMSPGNGRGMSGNASTDPTAIRSNARPDGASNGGHGIDEDEALGCSICTDDFVRGEDIRVLPCNHKYHPRCIDPWLLNVSGTCPLW
jgi:hypothetical protein